MTAPDTAALRQGAMAHRAFARRSRRDYDTRLKNAEHYIVVQTDSGLVIEPLGWALLAARGGDLVMASRGDDPSRASDALLQQGVRRIGPEDPAFAPLWDALIIWCRSRDTAPSARTGRPAREDRQFWVMPPR